MSIAESPTLSLAEAAQRLHVSPKTVRQRIKRGEIRADLVEGLHGPEYRVPAETLKTVVANDGFSTGAEDGTLNDSQGRVGNGTVEVDPGGLITQARREGQATLNGTLEGEGRAEKPCQPDTVSNHRAELLEQERDHLRDDRQRQAEEIAFLRQQLQAREDARREEMERIDQERAEMRRLLLTSQQLAHELAQQLEVKALPAHNDVQEGPVKKARWWFFGRR